MGGKKRIGTIIREALGLYRRNFFFLLFTSFLVYGVSYALGWLGSAAVKVIGLDSASLQHLRDVSFLLYAALGILSITFIRIFTIPGDAFTINAYDAMLSLHGGNKPGFKQIASNFAQRWLRYLGISAWSALWVFLWSFLFLIPGLVKMLSYLFAPYLIIEYPEMSIRQALRKSKEMTYGYKGRLFGLNLCIGLPYIVALFVVFIMYLGRYGDYKFITSILTPIFSLFILVPLGYMANTVAYADIKKAAQKKCILKK